MAAAPKPPLSLVPAETPAPFRPPRGPLRDAKWIVKHFYTTEDGRKLVSEKWVKETIPGKVRPSHSTAFWYEDDVVEYHERLRAQATR